MTQESQETIERLTTNLTTSIDGFDTAATVIKGQVKPKAKAAAKTK